MGLVDNKNSKKVRTWYYAGIVVIGFVVMFLLTYFSLRQVDYLPTISTNEKTEIGNSGKKESAYGFGYTYLQPGTYMLTVDAKTDAAGAYYEVVDQQTNAIYAVKEYTPGEEYHTVRFTTDRVTKSIRVRSTSGEGPLKVYGYTMAQEGRGCTDAKWAVLLGMAGGLLLFWGLYRARQKRHPTFFIVTGMAFFCALPFMAPSIQSAHDLSFHLARIEGIAAAIRDGQIPQRINTMFAGNGNITPMMYPQLMLMPSGFLRYSGTTVYFAYKAGCIFLTLLTAYLAWLGGRNLFGNDREGVLFAFFWLFNPFRLNEIYVRAAVGEAFAMAFLPLAAAGIWNLLYRDYRKGMMLTILGATGLLSSHVILTLLTVFMCGVLLMIRLISHPLQLLRDRRRLAAIGAAAFGSLLCNLWFLVPFLRFAGNDFLISGEYSKMKASGVFVWQIFMNPVAAGVALTGIQTAGEMSYSIGIYVLAGIFLLAVLCVLPQKISGNRLTNSLLLLGLTAFSIYLSTNWFPWATMIDHVKLVRETLGQVQYSWRFLCFAALFGCLTCTAVISYAERRWKLPILALLSTLTLLSASGAATEYYQNNSYADNKWASYLYVNLDYNLVSTDNNDNVTMWEALSNGCVPQTGAELCVTDWKADGTDYQASFEEAAASPEKLPSMTGESDACDQKLAGREICLPVNDNGLYHAYLEDGTELETAMAEQYQFTKVTVPEEIHRGTVYLRLESPLSFRISDWISGISILLMVGYYLSRMCLMRKKDAGNAAKEIS